MSYLIIFDHNIYQENRQLLVYFYDWIRLEVYFYVKTVVLLITSFCSFMIGDFWLITIIFITLMSLKGFFLEWY